ncbi:hypothetical protein [Lacticaseibacillus suibinensis]|uniref:hypothetical protein n=1 Tax=Lacticaseibacillus suibinensis TaxID=2486011 RepID=UPI000F7BA8CA|nr:hypothetical protein [Lacticaseibacillus suibinensis]
MADLELIKIENGMANGGTAIGANFDSVAAAVNATNSLAATSKLLWSKGVTNGSIFNNGFVNFSRHGSLVTINGLFSVARSFAAKEVIGQINDGFKPEDGKAYVQTSLGIATIDSQGLHTPAAIDSGGYLTIGGAYATNDDMPE